MKQEKRTVKVVGSSKRIEAVSIPKIELSATITFNKGENDSYIEKEVSRIEDSLLGEFRYYGFRWNEIKVSY